MIWLLYFSLTFFLQIGYWLLFGFGFRRARKQVPRTDALPPISVIVAARNEAANIPALLDALLQQTHPNYEVLIIDDDSEDATADLVREAAAAHPNLRLLQMQSPTQPRKKRALMRGIDEAQHELLALTDADCRPPAGWLAALAQTAAAATPDTLLVGYSPYRAEPTFLNGVASYETFITGIYTAAAIGLGHPYMGVGRNLAYTQALFHRIEGFKHSMHIYCGDDDLFIQEVVRQQAAPVRHVFGPETYVESEAPTSWRRWIHQKRRHTSVSPQYRFPTKVHLGIFHHSAIALWAAPFFLGWIGAALLGGKLLVQWGVMARAARVLRETRFVPLLPFWELSYTLYTVLVAPLGILFKPHKW